MKAARRIIAIGAVGVVIGTTMSMFTAAPATARLYAHCDQKIATMEKQASKDYDKGKLSAEDYDKVQQEIALHRELWGC